jgi:hypothetical protein
MYTKLDLFQSGRIPRYHCIFLSGASTVGSFDAVIPRDSSHSPYHSLDASYSLIRFGIAEPSEIAIPRDSSGTPLYKPENTVSCVGNFSEETSYMLEFPTGI